MTCVGNVGWPGLLCETDWLASHVHEPQVVVLDCEPLPLPTRLFRLPNWRKRNVSNSVFRGPTNAWRPTSPDGITRAICDRDGVEQLLGRLGISNDSHVVCISSGGGLWATFIWSVLDRFGHTNCHVVNGGLDKWRVEGRSLSRSHRRLERVTYTARPYEEAGVCTLADVTAALERPDHVFWDLRSETEWTGVNPMGTKRGGHIPGAMHLEWRSILTSTGTFKPVPELRALLADAGVTANKMVTTYCHSGVRAAFGIFVLRLLGYQRVRVYDASWSEYGNVLAMPVARS